MLRRSAISELVLCFLLICGSGVLRASESDELRERAKAIRKEAAELAARGNKDEAEQLKKEAMKLLQQAQQLEVQTKARGEPAIDTEVQNLKQRLHDLRSQERKLSYATEPELAEVRERIAGTERELRALQARHAGQVEVPPELRRQVEKLEAAARRVHHLRVAAENLKLADEHDLAHRLMEKAEGMEREVHEAKRQLSAQAHHEQTGERGPIEARELHAEVERLRAEIRELRQQLERR